MPIPRCTNDPKAGPCIPPWEDSLDILEKQSYCHPLPTGEECAPPPFENSNFVTNPTPKTPHVNFTTYDENLRDPQVLQDLRHYTSVQETADLIASDWIPKLQTALEEGDVTGVQSFMETIYATLGVKKIAEHLEALTPPAYSDHTLDYTLSLKNAHYKTKAKEIIARNFSKDCNQMRDDGAQTRMEWQLRNLREAHRRDLGQLEVLHQNALTRFERIVLTAFRAASGTQESDAPFLPATHEWIASFLSVKGESFGAYTQFHKAKYKTAELAKTNDRLWQEALSYRVRALGAINTPELTMYNKEARDAYAVARFHQKFLRDFHAEREKVQDFSLQAALFAESLGNAVAAQEGAIAFADFTKENDAAIQAYELLLREGGAIRPTLRRLAAAQDEQTIKELSKELEGKLALLGGKMASVTPNNEEREAYIKGFVGEMYASVLGDPSKVQTNYMKAWHAAHRSAQAEKDEAVLEDLGKEFRAYVKERLKETGGALNWEEVVSMMQNMGLILAEETDHNGFIERQFDDGKEKEARVRLDNLSEDVERAVQFLDPHRLEPEHTKEVTEWETKLKSRIAFDGNLSIHRADLALEGLEALAKEFPNSEFLKKKTKALAADRQHNGWLAASRERSVYLANSFRGWRRASRGALLTAAGSFGGAAVGCALGGGVGFFTPALGGTLMGCKFGATLGGGFGAMYGAYKNIDINVEEHRLQIAAAARSQLTRVTAEEYESYLDQYSNEMLLAGATALVPLPLPTRAGWRLFFPTIDSGRRFALWGAGHIAEIPKRYAAVGGWRGAEAALGEAIMQGGSFVYHHPFTSLWRGFQTTSRLTLGLLFGQVPGFNNVPAGVLNGDRTNRILVFLGQLKYDEALQALKGVGWREGLKNIAKFAWQSAESASLPYFVGELAYRFRNDPPENVEEVKLSFWGGISMLFSLVRLSPYLGVNKAGMSTVFLIDRVGDAALQWTSGQPLDEIDMYRLGMTFLTQTLIGTARGNWARDWILRQNPDLVRKLGVIVGDSNDVLRKLAWKELSAEEREVLRILLRSSNYENRIVIDAEGRIFGTSALNWRRVNPRRVTDANVVAQLNETERQAFARAISGGAKSWDDLFATASNGVQKFQIKGNPTALGVAYFAGVHDTLVGTLWDGVRGEYLMGADGLNMARWTLDRSLTFLPARQWLKLRLGWDSPTAILVDRLVGKYSTDWISTKYRPHYAKQGFGLKDYPENALGDGGGIDPFIRYHASDSLTKGGFGSWHWHYPFVINGASPFEPEDGAYERLPDHYASDKAFSPEERATLERTIDELIAEAKGRLKGWSAGSHQRHSSEYDDATVVETALAVSASAFVAYQKDPKFFGPVVKRHRDWFDVLESSGIATPGDVNDFIDTLTAEDDVWRRMHPLTQFDLKDPWYDEIPAIE